MADLIRPKCVTWLQADVMRKLRNSTLATKLHAFMPSHGPSQNGKTEYGITKLAERLGCGDTNRSKLRLLEGDPAYMVYELRIPNRRPHRGYQSELALHGPRFDDVVIGFGGRKAA